MNVRVFVCVEGGLGLGGWITSLGKSVRREKAR